MSYKNAVLSLALLIAGAPLSAGAAEHNMDAMAMAHAPPALSKLGGKFTLTDQAGRTVTDQDLRGRYALFYFGYAKCDVACPLALRGMVSAVRALGPLSSQVVPVFVDFDNSRLDPPAPRGAFEYTETPQAHTAASHQAAMHDMTTVPPMTQKEFATYVHAVDPRLVGLVGTRKQIWEILAEFQVRWEHQAAVTPAQKAVGYRVNHTTHMYLVGPDGKMAALFPYSETPSQMTKTMAKLIQKQPAATAAGQP